MTQRRTEHRRAVERALGRYAVQLHALIDVLESRPPPPERRRIVERIAELTAAVQAAAGGLDRRN